MSNGQKAAVWIGVLVALVVFGAIVLNSKQHCGGRNCINQHPVTPSASGHR